MDEAKCERQSMMQKLTVGELEQDISQTSQRHPRSQAEM